MKDITHFGNNEKLNLFLSYVLNDRKPTNEDEKLSIQCSFFAMELLIPTESFLRIVNVLGGIKKCNNPNIIKGLSEIYLVEEDLIKAKLKSLVPEFNKMPL